MKRKWIIILLLVVIVTGLGVRFVFPVLMTAMGLHPEYQGPHYQLAGGRALIVCTSHDRLGPDGDPTGVFGSELTAPYYEFVDSGLTVDIASIQGGPIPIDPLSFDWYVKSTYDDRYLSDTAFQHKVENSLKIDDVAIDHYDIVYLAGGWGAAYDLGSSVVLGDQMTQAYAGGKIIGGVCHGPLGLLLAKDPKGKPLVSGRRLTAVTDQQVKQLGITATPQHPERDLKAAGALYESRTAFQDLFANHIVVDGRLVTGQNQNAGPEVAQRMIELAGGTRR
jgi:putative intracellular protease/amidase